MRANRLSKHGRDGPKRCRSCRTTRSSTSHRWRGTGSGDRCAPSPQSRRRCRLATCTRRGLPRVDRGLHVAHREKIRAARPVPHRVGRGRGRGRRRGGRGRGLKARIVADVLRAPAAHAVPQVRGGAVARQVGRPGLLVHDQPGAAAAVVRAQTIGAPSPEQAVQHRAGPGPGRGEAGPGHGEAGRGVQRLGRGGLDIIICAII